MGTQTHTVLRGENLSIIAKNFSVDIDELAKENGIENKNILRVNQQLKIPEKKVRETADAKPNTTVGSAGIAWVIDRLFSTNLNDGAAAVGKILVPDWLDVLLEKLRIVDANECVQKIHTVAITKNDKPSKYTQQPAKTTHSKVSKKHEENAAHIKSMVSKEANVCGLHGVKLTENEKKQIIASVAVCEMNDDGFGTIGADYEFVGRSEKFETRGAETGYSRIVHIGLSYGVIQYTQDSGSLGSLLNRFDKKNHQKFVEIFGGGSEIIAKSLLELTTTGHPDYAATSDELDSGLEYWKKIRKTEEGKKIKKDSTTDADGDKKSDLAVEKEIRGKRVHPLVPKQGDAAIDIWTGVWKNRFKEAGKFIDFQDAQLDEAVEKYLNKVLPYAKANKIRSALALAFVAACKIRGADMELLSDVADAIGVDMPFENNADERKCIEAIAKARGNKVTVKIDSLEFSAYEAHRAKLLMNDDLGFLAEDYYDLSTYA